ncbi:glucose-methanol-choline oxidoreductase [Exophiala viscosa]|uniref:glucose-methanol-choline oxidoreductase n=1 Tax=Exophiala viscosa TaxID=2486360 RepID=UPI002195752C|nr:glucose-methanol-choline oxidoreductase [Exophiala viscosa]
MAHLRALDGAQFDYVVVGGGTSGCLVAARLALELPDQRILLVEAGPDDSADSDNLVPGLTKGKFGSKDGNWLYQTAPQQELRGREIVYPRGRGLGGSSANNFMAWVKGPSADYDDWADLVDDPWWRWDNVKQILNKLEDFRPGCPAGMEKYAKATPGAHGKNGPIAVQFPLVWQDLIFHCLEASQQAGHLLNADNNDGNPVGFAVAQFSVGDGVRVTSANAFLGLSQRRALTNLTIVPDTLCSRVLFGDNKASGVELIPSKLSASLGGSVRVAVSQEVILTAGTFQSAQLLLLSGIGPKSDLKALSIPVVADIPGVGKRIRDHSAFACEYVVSPDIAGHNQLLNSPELLEAAQQEYALSKSGPMSVFGASAALIFPRLKAVLSSPEFAQLDESTQAFLEKPTRPSTEIWMHSGPLFYTGPCPTDASILVIEGLNQNCLSEGSLKLRSRDPYDLPLVDPRYLTHPLDRRVAVETLREILRLSRTDALSKIIQTPLLAPEGDSERHLEDFIRETLTQGFHSMGTCVMGRSEGPRRVVNNEFEVVGVTGLRVADMSVCPILTCNHTQVNAYLIGLRCAEAVVKKAQGIQSRAKL